MDFLIYLMRFRSPVLDSFMNFVSLTGLPAVLFAAIVWIYLNNSKRTARSIMLSMLVSMILCQGLKLFFRVPRPWILEPDTSVFYPVSIAVASAGGYSFPSIHTQCAASFWENLIHYYKKNRVICVVACCILVLLPFSRMFLGCHTPQDVLTAFVIATAINILVWRFCDAAGSDPSGAPYVSVLIAGLGVLLSAFAAFLILNGTAEFALASDALQSGGVAAGYALSIYPEPRYIRFTTNGSMPRRIVRFVIAIAGFFMISKGLKVLGNTSIPVTFLRYFAGAVWMFLAAPLVSMRLGLMEAED